MAALLRVENTRNYPQGELFLLKRVGETYEALVYNTTGCNRCPADVFEAIDVVRLAEATGSDVVWKNARRFWVMDALNISLVGERRDLGGLEFNLVARMTMPPGFSADRSQAEMAYQPTKIHRVSRYEFGAGCPVQLLRSPQETTWVMQTYTNDIASDLTEADLPTMGDRLSLPEGWRYKSTVLQRDLVIDTDGVANIVPDELSNMYQGCIDGVNSFDPWQ
ncbi:hypothetical protein [Mycolicibacterium palauense]|uniref:hypothetical protein n=1 Tax=Mycolicibacterium palauense TaxID=2034511 RepID=UPI000BFED327|nr:hypothetical protein [Mycolicibacterium palauense]